MQSTANVEREPSSATKEVPPELRGRRIMTRLLALETELRARGVEPRTVHLSSEDEAVLFENGEHTFGRWEAAARESQGAWRDYLKAWFRSTVQLDVAFDARETRVS